MYLSILRLYDILIFIFLSELRLKKYDKAHNEALFFQFFPLLLLPKFRCYKSQNLKILLFKSLLYVSILRLILEKFHHLDLNHV